MNVSDTIGHTKQEALSRWATGLRWGGTEDGGGNLWLTTADGKEHKFSLDNNTTNVLLRALLRDATIRIEAAGQVVESR